MSMKETIWWAGNFWGRLLLPVGAVALGVISGLVPGEKAWVVVTLTGITGLGWGMGWMAERLEREG